MDMSNPIVPTLSEDIGAGIYLLIPIFLIFMIFFISI